MRTRNRKKSDKNMGENALESASAVENVLSSRSTLKKRLVEGDKKKFKKYVNSTTTHGVKHIFNGKSYIRRGFWGLLFIGMMIGCLHGVTSSIIAYAHIPTATTVFTDHVTSLTFPAVTICNLNSYNITYLEENNLTDIISQAVFQERDDRQNITEDCAAYVPPDFSTNATLFEVVAIASQPLDHLVAKCRFLGRPCNLSAMFIDYYTPIGRCFTFNGRNSARDYLSVSGGGFRNDLEVVLNIEQDLFVGSVNGEVGVLVSVHEQDAPALVWESGQYVPVGHSAYLGVTHKQIEDRTDRPFSDELECIHPSEAKPFEVFTSYNYSFRSCRGECIVTDLINNCSCQWTSNLNSKTYRHCNITDLCCVYGILKYTTDCPCPVLCNHTTYEVVPSYTSYPSPKEMKKLVETYNVSQEKVLQNFLKVHVFFNSLSISREITERSYSLEELFANIGGNMGLFLGASIISLTEFLTFIFDQIKDRLCGVRERKLKRGLDSFIVKTLRQSKESYSPEDVAIEDSSSGGFTNATYEEYTKGHVSINGNSEE